MYGIVDIGSNTIRLSVYKVQNNGFKSMFSKKSMAGLIGYVDEAGNMSGKGIAKAVSVLNDFKRILDNIEVKEVYMFATAALRNINNSGYAMYEICRLTGFDIELISGEQEAVYDYIGATHHIYVPSKGMVMDIGGGSTELVFYSEREIKKSLSIPFGSLNCYSMYVEKLLPGKIEIKKIQAVLKEELNNIDPPEGEYPVVCGIGGTIRAACKLNNDFFSMPGSNRQVDVANIGEIIKILREENRDNIHKILKIVPDRIHTIIPGMTILKTITKHFNTETVLVSEYGLREGYLYRKLVSNGIIREKAE
jgi:exopolyphosphatase/guanosine-5'-triphosphate,3'-diphosphate pyrophosphatase